jgi:hypothetical protein
MSRIESKVDATAFGQTEKPALTNWNMLCRKQLKIPDRISPVAIAVCQVRH